MSKPVAARTDADDAAAGLIATYQAIRTHLRAKTINWSAVNSLASAASSAASDLYFITSDAADAQRESQMAALNAKFAASEGVL
jgi:hypothetical protein